MTDDRADSQDIAKMFVDMKALADHLEIRLRIAEERLALAEQAVRDVINTHCSDSDRIFCGTCTPIRREVLNNVLPAPAWRRDR